MGVALRVGNHFWELGTGDFLHAFFSTISCRLEPGGWGTKFPTLMHSLYQGTLPAEHADAALSELSEAQEGLRAFPPSSVVWDINNLAVSPPWGDNISKHITSLANYFVTSDGRDLFEVVTAALSLVKKTGGQLTIG